ncbi:DUF4184 family protein [Nocardioides sp. QY071]|uniref:DUF4184 family protein n=1 Tax=Nocardioides sp. QY071 TaxID=3044187 RepID=UPI00249A192D|nr:DUF4184 family protein [Nocardioides sp. QY071]WGY02003.1 DUF4184 family protein [Nocardioides sp. QY071]
MPVTLAHPAAVLPLRGLGLPLSASVIGSMAPDLPVLVQTWGLYGFSHSLAGVVSIDLALTLALLAFWDLSGRDALVDTAPDLVRGRLPARARIGRRAWLLAPLAAVVGSLTHTLWDSFTHQGRWGVRHVAWLEQTHGALPGQQWAQFASGVLGLLVVGWAILRHVRRSPRVAPPAPAAARGHSAGRSRRRHGDLGDRWPLAPRPRLARRRLPRRGRGHPRPRGVGRGPRGRLAARARGQ